MRIETTAPFRRAFAGLPKTDFDLVSKALAKLPDTFGRPHVHAGLRKLRGGFYELRAGLNLRVLFRREGDLLSLVLLGTHDEIRRFFARL